MTTYLGFEMMPRVLVLIIEHQHSGRHRASIGRRLYAGDTNHVWRQFRCVASLILYVYVCLHRRLAMQTPVSAAADLRLDAAAKGDYQG